VAVVAVELDHLDNFLFNILVVTVAVGYCFHQQGLFMLAVAVALVQQSQVVTTQLQVKVVMAVVVAVLVAAQIMVLLVLPTQVAVAVGGIQHQLQRVGQAL
jgi:hypothetical protein